jgi:glutathione S-transferase
MAGMMLYMAPGSCSTAIHIILEELEEVFEATIVNLPAGDNRRPEYLAINPRGTIPSLRLREGNILTELVDIAVWLGRHCRRGMLWPADPLLQARAYSIMSHVTLVVHGEGFARVFVAGAFSSQGPESQVMRLGRKLAAEGLEQLGDMLVRDGYALGAFSVVDPIVFYVCFWADKTGIALPPRLAAHYRLMLDRPKVDQVLREEGYNPKTLGHQPASP